MQKINKEMAKHILLGLTDDGTFFSVEFVKKDGTIRSMNCRRGVKKYLTGEGAKYSPKNYNLLTVFDLKVKNYRNISLDTIRKIRLNKNEYEVA